MIYGRYPSTRKCCLSNNGYLKPGLSYTKLPKLNRFKHYSSPTLRFRAQIGIRTNLTLATALSLIAEGKRDRLEQIDYELTWDAAPVCLTA